jgi:hypothetical protein
MARPSLYWLCQFLLVSFIAASFNRKQSDPSFPAIPSNFTQPAFKTYSQEQLDQVAADYAAAQAATKIAVPVQSNIVSAQHDSDASSRKSRLDNPIRNVYTRAKDAPRVKRRADASLLPVPSDVVAAAALLAEVDAAAKYDNGTLFKNYQSMADFKSFGTINRRSSASSPEPREKRQSSTFWMEKVDMSLGNQVSSNS